MTKHTDTPTDAPMTDSPAMDTPSTNAPVPGTTAAESSVPIVIYGLRDGDNLAANPTTISVPPSTPLSALWPLLNVSYPREVESFYQFRNPPKTGFTNTAEWFKDIEVTHPNKFLTPSTSRWVNVPTDHDSVTIVSDRPTNVEKRELNIDDTLVNFSNLLQRNGREFSLSATVIPADEGAPDNTLQLSNIPKEDEGNETACRELGGEKTLSLTFHRTVRLPDDNRLHHLPSSLGMFPLYNVAAHADRLPENIVKDGGVFMPMWQREAMWLRFDVTGGGSWAIRAAAGGINVVTGEKMRPLEEVDWTGKDGKQDWVVLPQQPWLDGVCVEEGVVRQFVAMPLGGGYTIEGQKTGKEKHGGLQLEIIPLHEANLRFWYPAGTGWIPESFDETKTPRELGCTEGDTLDAYVYPGYRLVEHLLTVADLCEPGVWEADGCIYLMARYYGRDTQTIAHLRKVMPYYASKYARMYTNSEGGVLASDNASEESEEDESMDDCQMGSDPEAKVITNSEALSATTEPVLPDSTTGVYGYGGEYSRNGIPDSWAIRPQPDQGTSQDLFSSDPRGIVRSPLAQEGLAEPPPCPPMSNCAFDYDSIPPPSDSAKSNGVNADDAFHPSAEPGSTSAFGFYPQRPNLSTAHEVSDSPGLSFYMDYSSNSDPPSGSPKRAAAQLREFEDTPPVARHMVEINSLIDPPAAPEMENMVYPQESTSAGLSEGYLLAKHRISKNRGARASRRAKIQKPTPAVQSLGLAMGGKLIQDIVRDSQSRRLWDIQSAIKINVHFLSPSSCEAVTHIVPPPPVMTLKEYLQLGNSFYVVEEDEEARLAGGDFGNILSVGEMDAKKLSESQEEAFDPLVPRPCACGKRLCDCIIRPCGCAWCNVCVKEMGAECGACGHAVGYVAGFSAPMDLPGEEGKGRFNVEVQVYRQDGKVGLVSGETVKRRL